MASGNRFFLWFTVVACMVIVGSLAGVGLLPGQARNQPISVRVTATTTTVPRRVTTSLPATVPPPPSTAPVLTSPEPTGPSTTAPVDASPTTVPPATTPATTRATTAPPGTSGTNLPKLDPSDPTCVAIRELIDMIDDPSVRGLVEAEYRNSGCAG